MRAQDPIEPTRASLTRSREHGRRTRGAGFVLAGVALTLLLFGGVALATAAGDLAGDEVLTDTTTGPAGDTIDDGSTSVDDGSSSGSTSDEPVGEPPPSEPAPPPVEETPPPPVEPLPEPSAPPVPIVPQPWAEEPELAAPDPEVADPESAATIWLYRTLPDPTPPAKRLALAFARRLAGIAHREGVRWTVLLGVLRASGRDGGVPATAREIRALARRLVAAGVRKRPWAAIVAHSGRPDYADQALALARYNRAVGLKALVVGLAASKPSFQKRTLSNRRMEIYPAGRVDIVSGRIDVRVLVLMLYLRRAYGEVTVSSLHSGHGVFARPGVVSAHVYGLAVDISALGNVPIAGNQAPNGLTEHAVRDILLLPAELQPRQIISLLGLGGPSFPLADHADHIHVGY